MAQEPKIEVCEVRGRMIEFDDGRIAFVGHKDGAPDKVFIAFRSKAGEDLKFMVSVEAWDALFEMRKNPMLGMPLRDFPHRVEWKRVVDFDGTE